MKKTCILVLTIILASACAKADYIEEYSGSRDHSYSIAEKYLRLLATDLIPDYLISLESALAYDEYEYYKTSAGKSSYETGGKSIRDEGAVWTVSAKKKVDGLKISCVGDGVWTLEREGAYSFFDEEDEESYITQCTARVQMLEDLGNSHYSWKVTFSGSRTEREGYSCVFQSAPELAYTCLQTGNYTWDMCNGAATILIDKNGEKVDMARMNFDGQATTFFRGL